MAIISSCIILPKLPKKSFANPNNWKISQVKFSRFIYNITFTITLLVAVIVCYNLIAQYLSILNVQNVYFLKNKSLACPTLDSKTLYRWIDQALYHEYFLFLFWDTKKKRMIGKIAARRKIVAYCIWPQDLARHLFLFFLFSLPCLEQRDTNLFLIAPFLFRGSRIDNDWICTTSPNFRQMDRERELGGRLPYELKRPLKCSSEMQRDERRSERKKTQKLLGHG